MKLRLLYFLVLIAVTKSTSIYNTESGLLNALPGDEFVFRFSSVRDGALLTTHVSSGVAISENIGLVTAQAIDDFDFFYIGHGSIQVAEHEIQSINKNNIKIHPDFNPDPLLNNIAVIKFTTPVLHYVEIATIPLPFPIMFTFVYGVTDPTLRLTVAMQTNPSACEVLHPNFEEFPPLCTVYPRVVIFKAGNQGGPMIDYTRNYVHGLISNWDNEQNILVGVDLIYYKIFIDTSIAELMLDV